MLDNGEPCWNDTSMDNLDAQTGEPLETGHVIQPRPRDNGEPILSENDAAVIHERFHGWERASAKTLAAVFGVSVQRITSIVRERKPS